jgi:uracil-DNA glycosylase family 4
MATHDPATALAQLRERVLARPCPDGRRPVFGTGSPTPRLCIVGEGPAERDEQTGRPFSGPAGDLLMRALAEAGLRQEEAWFTNVLKCRAVVQKDGRWVNRPPTDPELAAALPLLDEELALLRPRAVLCLGATAARALLGKRFNFTRDRGHWFPTLSGLQVLATYLPAYVLRREGPDFDAAYAELLSDIRTAAERMDADAG